MVAKQSIMTALGTPVPEFNLPNTNGLNQLVSNTQFKESPLLVMFICNHCPFVIHIIEQAAKIGNEFQGKGMGVVAISSNDIETYPQDSPEKMQQFAQQYGIEFAYCFDESQQIAKDFGAACTPDFFVYDSNHNLQYRGQFDASRPSNNEPVTGEDLKKALQCIISGEEVFSQQTPSIGCNIKWKEGNEPAYF